MKSSRNWSLRIVAIIAAMVLFSGCASTKMRRLSGARFIKQADQIEQINSAHWTSYVGASRKRAYLEFGYPALIGGGTRTVVYWAPLDELPAEIANELKMGNAPWKPWAESK